MTPPSARQVGAYRLAGVVLATPVLLWFAGWLLVGDNLLPVRWGAYVAPWLVLVLVVAAVLFALARSWWWLAATATIALLLAVPILPRFNPVRLFPKEARATDIRVLTFNSSDSNDDFQAIAALIVRERPDIVFLQQLSNQAGLQAALDAQPQAPRYVSAPPYTADTLILSRFAVSGAKLFDARTTAIVTIGACRIRLWSVHAPHGQYTPQDQRIFFDDTAHAVAGETLPVLAGGDLNSTEYNSLQAPLRDQLRDAFADAGSGLGFTFPSPVRRFGKLGTLFRIDHVFYRGLEPVSAWRVSDSAGSDHLPVMATFRRPPNCP
jgi:endonuclease/exonuclease/phosphatase (EEP) superfamily protein YafD